MAVRGTPSKMGGVVVRKVIGAFVVLSVAVVLRGGDIFYGPAWKALSAFGGSTASSVSRDGALDRSPSNPDGAALPKPAQHRPLTGKKNLPPDFIDHPLLFLSTAPADSLVLLPGIGPVLAERIVGVRTGKRSFTRWDDLLVVKGIGPKTLDRLKGLK